MIQEKVILVSGVSNYWGLRVAQRLIEDMGSQEDQKFRVIGLDTELPLQEIKGLDFIQADVRNPILADLLKTESVHTVCHLVFNDTVRSIESLSDVNVMGTMKLLGACAEAGVHKVVLKSSMEVYGASPSNSAFLSEIHPLSSNSNYASLRDLIEIESFCSGFRQQVPEIDLTILRFSSIVGPQVDSSMTRFLKQPMAPVLLGFDPRMQVIHEDDVVGCLVFAIHNHVPGVFNVAAEGVLPLSKLIALAAKIPIPVFHPFIYLGARAAGFLGGKLGQYLPFDPDYLRYPWVGNLDAMRDILGFLPRYTAEEALREFAGEQRLQKFMPESAALAYDEERLRDTIDRRSRARERGDLQG